MVFYSNSDQLYDEVMLLVRCFMDIEATESVEEGKPAFIFFPIADIKFMLYTDN